MENKQRAKFLSLYCMLLADGVIDHEELQTIYKIGRESYDFTSEQIDKMVVTVGASLPELNTIEERVSLLYQMAQVAWADKRIDESERNLLAKYVRHYGFIEENVDTIVDFLLEQAQQEKTESEVLQQIIS